jgi:hypothetical protein
MKRPEACQKFCSSSVKLLQRNSKNCIKSIPFVVLRLALIGSDAGNILDAGIRGDNYFKIST